MATPEQAVNPTATDPWASPAAPQPVQATDPWAAPQPKPVAAAPAPAQPKAIDPWAKSAVANGKPIAVTDPWAGQAPKEETAPAVGHWWDPTRSVLNTAAQTDVAENLRQKISTAFHGVLPESMKGNWLVDFADEASKAGPGFINFLTSPAGIGLAAAHLFPVSAPYAAAADVALGGWQALQAVPDTIDALVNYKDGRRAGKVAVDLLGAYAGIKGGGRIAEAVRAIPAEAGAGLPPLKQVGAMATEYGKAFRRTAPPPVPPPSERAADLRARLDAADPEDRPAILEEAATPKNLREKAEMALYRTPGVRGVVENLVPSVRRPAIGDLGKDLVDNRNAAIGVEMNRLSRFADWMQRNVPEGERDIRRMGYAMEGDLPETDLSPPARSGLEKIRELNRSKDEMLKDVYGEDLSLMSPESYLRHYWDFDNGGLDPAQRASLARSMKDKSLQERTVRSLKMGIEGTNPETGEPYGLKPRYNDVTDVVVRRHMEAVYAAENQRLANTLRDYGLIVNPTKANIGEPGWRPAADAPALKRAVYAGEGKDGEAIFKEKAPLVHPDIQMAVNTIFNEPWKGGAWTVVNQIRALQKQLAVGLSVFHTNTVSAISQGEAAGAGGLGAIPRVARAIAWPVDPEFIRGVRAGIWEVQGKTAPDAPVAARLAPEAIEPWLKANLPLQSSLFVKTLNGQMGESEGAAIRAAMDFMKNRGPVAKTLGLPVRLVGDAQYIFNHALFDYYVPGQMLNAAETIFGKEMARLGPDASPALEGPLRREIADHVSRVYRTENWQRLMVTPKAQQALSLAFFAPQWMLSGLRTLTKGYESTTGSRLTNRYVAGAALTYFLTSQLANYAMSEWAAKHNPDDPSAGAYWDEDSQTMKRGGHWTWQNPGDPVSIGGKVSPSIRSHSAEVYRGQNPDGSQSYIQPGKSAQDTFLWFSHPWETLMGKLSIPLRQILVQATKSTPGSGYPVIDSTLPERQQNEQRAAQAVEGFIPFSAQTTAQRVERAMDPEVFREVPGESQFFGIAARRGASFNNSVKAMREAIDNGQDDVAEQIERNAAVNGIDMKGVFNELKKRYRRQARTAAGRPKTDTPPVAPAPVANDPWK